jgi:hypothetical protein
MCPRSGSLPWLLPHLLDCKLTRGISSSLMGAFMNLCWIPLVEISLRRARATCRGQALDGPSQATGEGSNAGQAGAGERWIRVTFDANSLSGSGRARKLPIAAGFSFQAPDCQGPRRGLCGLPDAELMCGCPRRCKRSLVGAGDDRVRSCVRPRSAALPHAAGRYGDTQARGKITTASAKLDELSLLFPASTCPISLPLPFCDLPHRRHTSVSACRSGRRQR